MYVGVYGNSGAVMLHFVLSSASRDNLDTFVGASPRRGTGVWRDTLYVAGEEWVPLRSVHFSRDDECDVMAHASNTTAVIEAGWRATIRPALGVGTKAIVCSPAGDSSAVRFGLGVAAAARARVA